MVSYNHHYFSHVGPQLFVVQTEAYDWAKIKFPSFWYSASHKI